MQMRAYANICKHMLRKASVSRRMASYESGRSYHPS